MGHGIAQVSAQAGYQVIAVESSDAALAAGIKRIDGSLAKVISKDVAAGKITEVGLVQLQNFIFSIYFLIVTKNE